MERQMMNNFRSQFRNSAFGVLLKNIITLRRSVGGPPRRLRVEEFPNRMENDGQGPPAEAQVETFNQSSRTPMGEQSLDTMTMTMDVNKNDHDEEISDFELFVENGLCSEKAFPTMEKIRREGRLCDIKLIVEDSIIEAHRIVLAGSIPYFRVMFTSDMVESRKGEVTLHGLEYEALEHLVNFAYTGRVLININNVQSIMISASFLQINTVKNFCSTFLIKRLQPENVLGMRAFGQLLCEKLVQEADLYIQRNFRRVSITEEFLQLELADILSILGRDELNVESEEYVYQAMMSWIKKDPELRNIHLPQLLKQIRMSLLSPQFIRDQISSEILIKNDLQCRDLLDEARDYFLIPERRPFMTVFSTKPRYFNGLGKIFVIGGVSKTGDSISTIEILDPITMKWNLETKMKMFRSRVGVCEMKNCLYLIGGFNGQDRLDRVEVYNPCTSEWKTVSSMNFKRSAVGAATLNGCLYVCGGYDGSSSLNSVEIYNSEKDTWLAGPSMNKCRSAAGVVSLGNSIYAIGGHDGLSIFDSVERFDPILKVWVFVQNMLTKRCRLGASSLHSKLYVCGGYDGSTFLNSVEVYDTLTNCWTELKCLNMRRSRVALCPMNGQLWAIGGYDGISNLNSVESYNPETNEWTNEKPLTAHEGGVGVGVIPLDVF